MPDNPRGDHHTDIPSSRHSGGTPNPYGSSSGGNYYSPTQQPPNPPSKKIKNIIIGSIVTIVTSTTVFLITQYLKKPENGDTYSGKKEATIEAWDSYKAYEDIYTKNVFILDSTVTDGTQLLKEIKKESEKFVKDLTDLKKKKNIDNDLLKAFDRRLENEKGYLPPFEEYLNKTMALQNSTKTQQEKIDEQAELLNDWIQYYKTKYDRAINDIKEIGQLLSGRYPHAFDMNNFEIVKRTPDQLHKMDSMLTILQNTTVDEKGNIIVGLNFSRNVKPGSITGKWSTPGMEITIHADGKLSWVVNNGGEASGKWKIENDKLKVDAIIMPDNKKVSWTFKFAYITANSFVLANDDPPYEIYRMTRMPNDE